MTMRYAHLSPAHLRIAVNQASLYAERVSSNRSIVSQTVSGLKEVPEAKNGLNVEGTDLERDDCGGAERGRTAASQFCRLLP